MAVGAKCPASHWVSSRGTSALKEARKKALAFVISLNLKRRNLDDTQRSLIAAELAKLPRGGDHGNQHVGGKSAAETSPTEEKAAELLNVSEAAIKRAKRLMRGGTAQLKRAVEDKTITLTDAASVTKYADQIQDAAVAAEAVAKLTETKTGGGDADEGPLQVLRDGEGEEVCEAATGRVRKRLNGFVPSPGTIGSGWKRLRGVLTAEGQPGSTTGLQERRS
jgi:hypothetical protein